MSGLRSRLLPRADPPVKLANEDLRLIDRITGSIDIDEASEQVRRKAPSLWSILLF